MATLVDISQSKFDGGISTLIPFKDSGNSKEPSLLSFFNQDYYFIQVEIKNVH